jgi:hypothetical protein
MKIFEKIKTCNTFLNPETISNDPDLYCMSENAYNQTWIHTTKRPYSEHGRPSSINVLWKKDVEDIAGSFSLINNNSISTINSKQQFTFFIVTPSLNSYETIDQTIQSIITQKGDFSIRYHVQDGGSTDGTIEKLTKWKTKLSQQSRDVKCRGIDFTWASEPDQGMYDAVIKGFDQMFISPENFMTWINSDDLLMPGALTSVCSISENIPEVHWIGGAKHIFDNKGVVYERIVPFPTDVIRKGLCDGIHWNFLQQEGMFFKKNLWFKSKHSLSGFKLAGDWNLWREMAHHTEYYQFEKPFGAFRRREGQLSVVQLEGYRQEIDSAITPEIRAESLARLHKINNLPLQQIILEIPSGKPKLEKIHTTVIDRI